MESVLICSAIFLVAVVFGLSVFRHNRAAFHERFPPISDTEFLARCKPGINPAVALKVRQIVAEYFAIAYDRVYPEMTFTEDLGTD